VWRIALCQGIQTIVYEESLKILSRTVRGVLRPSVECRYNRGMAGRPKRTLDLARLAGEEDLRELVWTRMEEGATYSAICYETDLGKAALLEWLHAEENAPRASRARARAAAALVDEGLEIADQSGDAKLRVGQRNWIAERWDRAAFGQKVEVEHKGNITHQHLEALQGAAKARRLPQSQADVLDVEVKTLEQQLADL
jgi:hypothetical protein